MLEFFLVDILCDVEVVILGFDLVEIIICLWCGEIEMVICFELNVV